MPSKDKKNLAQVIDKIASMDEPARSLVQRVHEVIVATVHAGLEHPQNLTTGQNWNI